MSSNTAESFNREDAGILGLDMFCVGHYEAEDQTEENGIPIIAVSKTSSCDAAGLLGHQNAIASCLDLEPNARTAAQHACQPADGVALPPFNYVAEMDNISAGAYFRLRRHLGRAASVVMDDTYWSTLSFV
ncbi:hypothetical protein EUX98_g4501 [Antrodiella citrinella]|uniref:Uncharacterized protein n=1 Tax=Antrodiella citrinella TaxID=2447956 RepID=A0A4S4N1T7_9APHY|nr:hypothetical protein EUX98_g4501 [Antrodiella citrinella]